LAREELSSLRSLFNELELMPKKIEVPKFSRQGNKEFKFGQTNLEPTQHVEKPKLLLLPKLCMQRSPVLHHI
jgi:hypothetical protein